jgi:hypothetical protein
MTVHERVRLEFEIDLTDSVAVFNFPEFFWTFLKDHGRDFDAEQFWNLVSQYMAKNPAQEWSLDGIITIADYYADVVDTSGVDPQNNPLMGGALGPTSSTMTAEEVADAPDRDLPREQTDLPLHHDVVVVQRRKGDIRGLAYDAIIGLRKKGASRDSDRLANELREHTRDAATFSKIEFIKNIQEYVTCITPEKAAYIREQKRKHRQRQ